MALARLGLETFPPDKLLLETGSDFLLLEDSDTAGGSSGPQIGGLTGAARFQYQGLAQPLVFLAPTTPDLIPASLPDLVRRPRLVEGWTTTDPTPPAAPAPDLVALSPNGGLRRTRTTLEGWTTTDPTTPAAPAPDQPWGPPIVPVRRRPWSGEQRTVAFAELPPPSAGDIFGAFKPERPMLLKQTWAHFGAASWWVQPVGQTAAEPLPSSQWPMPRAQARTWEGWYASPVDRPVIPFNPAQQVATLPQPPRPVITRHYLRLAAGVLPPLSMVLPVPDLSWRPQLRDLPVIAPPRPTTLQSFAFWPEPIPPVPAPDSSWQGRYPDYLWRSPSPIPRLPSAFANLDPLPTPAFVFASWSTQPDQWPPRRALQLPGESPLPIEGPAILPMQAWRSEYPDLLWRVRPPTPTSLGFLLNLGAIAEGVPCILVADVQAASSTLTVPALTSATLTEPVLTQSTLLRPEVC